MGESMKELLLKKWCIATGNEAVEERLMQALGIHPLVARLLVNRHLETSEVSQAFLQDTWSDMHDPFLLLGMDVAVDRIIQAMTNNEKIVIYGDYDVDGISSTALLYHFFLDEGVPVSYYIPDRKTEGYGLNIEAVEALIAKGTDLLITVDCGISSYEIVDVCKDRLDIIITDHHTVPEHVPPALAVINPKQRDCKYPFKELAGVGVAYKLCQAMHVRLHQKPYREHADIVALGTVADLMQLRGENRILVKEGIEALRRGGNIGLSALIEVADVPKEQLSAGHIAYSLAPRLNAAGRVAHAREGVALLIANNREEAMPLANILQEANMERQEIEKNILEEAKKQVLSQGDMAKYALVVDGKDWHPGVIGIVASRLIEAFYKPTFMITVSDGVGKGSCRSIEGFDIYAALESASHLFMQFGGHKQAAGFSIAEEQIPALREHMNTYCKEHLIEEQYIPTVRIDTLISEEDITPSLVREIALLEPYGMGNETPVFAYKEAIIESVQIIGRFKQHMKLELRIGSTLVEGLLWFAGDLQNQIFPGMQVNVAFQMQVNEWQGMERVQLLIQDVQIVNPETVYVTEDELRTLYPKIKRLFFMPRVEKHRILSEVVDLAKKHGESMKKWMLAIEIFKELGIIEERREEGMPPYFYWHMIKNKLDLVTSMTFIKHSK